MRGLRCIGGIRDGELEGLRIEVEEIAPHFADETWRQDHPASPHGDTEALFLRWPGAPNTIDVIFNSMECRDTALIGILPMCRWAVGHIAELVGLPPARALLVRLKPGGIVRLHSDQGAYAHATHRFHLAINSNPECVMQVGYTVAGAPPGSIYFFDKSLPHAVFNCGETPRDHLIVDVFK